MIFFINVILCIYVISIPFKNAFFQISTVILILIFMFNIIKDKEYTYFKELLYKFKEIVFVFGLIVVSMLISNSINDTSQTKGWYLMLVYIYRYFLIFIVLIYFYSKNYFSIKKLTIFVLISLSIQGFDGLYQAIVGFDYFKNNIGNIYSGLTAATFNRNTFGFFMGLGLLITFLFINKKELFDKINFILIPLLFIFIFCTFFSYSRAVWIALLVSFSFLLMVNFKKITFNNIILILITIFIIFSVVYNVDSLFNRFESLINGNSSGRNIIWSKAITLIIENPIFGFGLDTWNNLGVNNSIHNIVLELLFYLGIFGLIVFSLMFYMMFKENFKNKDYSLLSILIFFCIDSQFDQSIISGKIFISSLFILMFFTFRKRLY